MPSGRASVLCCCCSCHDYTYLLFCRMRIPANPRRTRSCTFLHIINTLTPRSSSRTQSERSETATDRLFYCPTIRSGIKNLIMLGGELICQPCRRSHCKRARPSRCFRGLGIKCCKTVPKQKFLLLAGKYCSDCLSHTPFALCFGRINRCLGSRVTIWGYSV